MEIKLYFYCFKLSNSDFLVLIQSLAWKKTQSPLSHNGHSPLPETALLTLSKTFDGSPLLLNEEVHCPEPAFHAHCSLPLVRLVHSWPWKLPRPSACTHAAVSVPTLPRHRAGLLQMSTYGLNHATLYLR